ncbi:MAG: hypothetical protein ACREA9_06650, partial [Pyrinomonadaceae bacterium]
MIPIDGHVSITGDGPEQVGEILACQKLPRCVVFVPDRYVAEAILQHGAHGAVQEAVEDDWALVWMSAAEGPVQKLCFDSSGRITRDAVFSLAYWELRVAAGSSIENGDDERSYVIRGHERSITFGAIPVADQQIRIGTSASRDAGQITFSGKFAFADTESSLRYFYRSATGPVAGFKYPIFRAGANSESFMPVDVRIHPTHAADSSRNQVTMNSSTGAGSNFLSVAGNSLGLAIIPNRSGIGQQWDPVQQELYPVPIGDWRLDTGATGFTGATGEIDLMCGLSGLEYAKVADGSIMRFVANSPAYAPHFLTPSKTGGTQSLIADCPGSELPVTTSWIYFGPDGPSGMAQKPVLVAATGPTGPQGYYSQPVKGGLFQADQKDAFLQVLQLQTANFPPGAPPVFGAPQASFPMVPYAGVGATTTTEGDLYNRFEVEVLSPTRSNAIFAMNQPATDVTAAGPMGLGSLPGVRTGLTAPTAVTGPMAVTPQGMLSTFSPDYSAWLRLIMATTGDGATLELQNLNLTLRAALLTNQLFLVIANPTILESYCTVVFPELTIGGWSFDLKPDGWRADSVLILKFAEKPLEGLINDLSLWSAPGSKLNYGTATQTVLKNSIAEAQANA